MSLEEKVRAIIIQDDTGDGPISTVAQQPDWEGFRATPFELDLLDWGCVYGMAFGLARAEEPCEPLKDVARRAYEAAWPAYVAYGTEIEEPERDQAIERLRTRVAEVRDREVRTGKREIPEVLEDALAGVFESQRGRGA